jgi:hypothetical protein
MARAGPPSPPSLPVTLFSHFSGDGTKYIYIYIRLLLGDQSG